jgi:L-lysine exporter family protein LysE/ArgO
MMFALIQAGAAFMYGLGIGFVNSIPVGPINISIIDTSFKRGFWQAFMIGLGALIVDVGYCAIGIFGIALMRDYVVEFFQPLGFPVLASLGARLIYKGRGDQFQQTFHPATQKELTKNFSMGFMIYLTNPLAVGFWIFTAGFIFSYQMIEKNMPDKVSFIIGMTLGTTLWFFLLAKIVAWKRMVISENTIRKISVGTGIMLLLFGMYLGYQYAMTFVQ